MMLRYYIDIKKAVPRSVGGLLVLLIVLSPIFSTNMITLSILISSGIWAMAAMGFTLILRTGQFSMGQAAFMAIGGYTSAILTVNLGWPFWAGFLLSGVVSGIISFLVGAVVLRVGGTYFSIITLALGEIVRIAAQEWEPVTKGSRGLVTSAPNPIVLGGPGNKFLCQRRALFLFHDPAGGNNRPVFLATGKEPDRGYFCQHRRQPDTG